jgi:hypothetical protein
MDEMDSAADQRSLNYRIETARDPRDSRTISRREWFRASIGGSVGLAVGGLIDAATVRAATKELKLGRAPSVVSPSISKCQRTMDEMDTGRVPSHTVPAGGYLLRKV